MKLHLFIFALFAAPLAQAQDLYVCDAGAQGVFRIAKQGKTVRITHTQEGKTLLDAKKPAAQVYRQGQNSAIHFKHNDTKYVALRLEKSSAQGDFEETYRVEITHADGSAQRLACRSASSTINADSDSGLPELPAGGLRYSRLK